MSTLTQKGFAITKNILYSTFLQRATKLLGKPLTVAVTLREVARKLDDQDSQKGPIQQTIDMGRLVVRLVAAYVSGSYRQVATETIVSGVAVLLYVLSPVDVVPDFIPVLGFMDDVALISWFTDKFRAELDRFKAWEQTPGRPLPAPARPNPELPAVAELGHS